MSKSKEQTQADNEATIRLQRMHYTVPAHGPNRYLMLDMANALRAARPAAPSRYDSDYEQGYKAGARETWDDLRDSIANICAGDSEHFDREYFLDYVNGDLKGEV